MFHRLAEHITVNTPTGGRGDDEIRFVFLEEIAIEIGCEVHLHPHEQFTCPFEGAQEEDGDGGGKPDAEAEFPAVFFEHFPDVAVFGFVVDAPRAADPPQVDEQRLDAGVYGLGVLVGFFEPQPFEDKPVLPKALGDAIFGLVVGEEDDFDARIEQRLDDVALQEVDERHAVIGDDEDAFFHSFFEPPRRQEYREKAFKNLAFSASWRLILYP